MLLAEAPLETAIDPRFLVHSVQNTDHNYNRLNPKSFSIT